VVAAEQICIKINIIIFVPDSDLFWHTGIEFDSRFLESNMKADD